MLERKDKKMPKETVRLFILLFMSLLYALFKFSANLPSMPACNPFYSSTFHGISCGRQWRSFAVLYCTPNRHVFVFVKSLLPMLINTLTVLKEEYRIYLASLQQSDIQTWNPYRNSPRES